MDETLTAGTSGISDSDGIANVVFTHQWIARDGSADSDISGETGATYSLVANDQGKTIKVKVSFSDDAGNPEELTSAGTPAVVGAAEPPPADSEDTQNPQEPPSAPWNLTATVDGDGSVTLNWNAPDDGPVTGYQILRRQPGEGEHALSVYVADTGSTATSYTDTGVTAGTLYVYRVKAINSAGVGQRSKNVKVTP